VLGFNVPKLLRTDDDLLAIEMTVVRRPYVLDFAGSTTNRPNSRMRSGASERKRRSSNLAPMVDGAATHCRISWSWNPLLDVSPGNIAFGSHSS
jgi:hypothetical protein